MAVEIEWDVESADPLPGQDNIARVLRHGSTLRLYLNVSKEEAEKRFLATSPDARDGVTVYGAMLPYSDELSPGLSAAAAAPGMDIAFKRAEPKF